jgi:hypothetical protein
MLVARRLPLVPRVERARLRDTAWLSRGGGRVARLPRRAPARKRRRRRPDVVACGRHRPDVIEQTSSSRRHRPDVVACGRHRADVIAQTSSRADVIEQTSSSRRHRADVIEQTSSSRRHRADVIEQTSPRGRWSPRGGRHMVAECACCVPRSGIAFDDVGPGCGLVPKRKRSFRNGASETARALWRLWGGALDGTRDLPTVRGGAPQHPPAQVARSATVGVQAWSSK